MDDDGYAVGDPYAEAAKGVDRAAKEKSSKAMEAAKALLDNKDTIKYYERYFKMFLIVVIVVYVAAVNSDGKEIAEFDWIAHGQKFVDAALSADMWKDWFGREGAIFAVVVTLYLLARKTNNYLDTVEEEIKQEKMEQKKKEAMVKKSGLD